MPDSDYRRAQQYYARIRQSAYAIAREEAILNSRIDRPFTFTEIDAAALEAWRTSWRRKHPLGYGGWPWEEIVRPVWRRPSGFHLAIWSEDCLCGFAVGRTSKRRPSGRRHTLSVHYLEANPDPHHPLKGHVASLAFACADAYGATLGGSTLRLLNPLPGVVRLYVGLGFSVAGRIGDLLYLDRTIKER